MSFWAKSSHSEAEPACTSFICPRRRATPKTSDYVRSTRSGVGPILDAVRSVATGMGLDDRGTDFAGPMVHTRFDADPTSGAGRIRVKVEINIAETESFGSRIVLPYGVDSPWWTGKGEVMTFALEELLGTKLRALYQRSKGRDLFDLWLVLAERPVDDSRIVDCFHHYIGEGAFTFAQLSQNLAAKLFGRDFRGDLSQLVIEPPQGYDAVAAANLVMERLGPHLRNAPARAAIRDGAWRKQLS